MLSDCKYIRDCTIEVAYEVASNLRPEDRSECVEGWGINPLREIPLASQRGFCVSFMVPNGETAGVAGILMVRYGCYVLLPSISIPSPLLEKQRGLLIHDQRNYFTT